MSECPESMNYNKQFILIREYYKFGFFDPKNWNWKAAIKPSMVNVMSYEGVKAGEWGRVWEGEDSQLRM